MTFAEFFEKYDAEIIIFGLMLLALIFGIVYMIVWGVDPIAIIHYSLSAETIRG